MSSNFDSNVSIIPDISTEIIELKNQRKNLDQQINRREADAHTLLEDFYKLADASERLDISPQSILRKIKSGKYVGVRFNKSWYIKSDQVDDEYELISRLKRGV